MAWHGVNSAVRALQSLGMIVTEIVDVTPVYTTGVAHLNVVVQNDSYLCTELKLKQLY